MKNKLAKPLSIVVVLILAIIMLTQCTPKQEAANKTVILSTTTSTQSSGLLDYLMPLFKSETGYNVKVVAVGTGQALKMGEDGEADVLLVHSKSDEEKFVQAGHGLKRYDVMYNDFILIGPKDDSAKVAENAQGDILKAFEFINKNTIKFVSRGDDSGTHKKEMKLWKDINVTPAGDWYISAGKGMGEVIQMANEMQAYTLADRGTYLSMKDKTDMVITIENSPNLFNQYGVIAVNPAKNNKINAAGAEAFVKWILSDKTQKLIGDFQKEKYGQSLFVPNAQANQ